MIGKTLSERYKILDKISDGGMASIYRAEDLRLKRVVAIKVLNEQLARDQEILSRFIREAQSAARLIHPNIVNVYDIEEFQGLHYIVMEYVDARNLKEVISRKPRPRFDNEAILLLFRQIGSAVKFAHENGIIHRDLKPQNVLVTDQGVIKVTDFGIARAVSASSLTRTGTMMGTVQYFSPEQAQGKHIDRTTDIYSLGIILFELLTGRLPFEGNNLVSVALKQVQEDPPVPSSFSREITPAEDRVILKALSKNPGERYQDMDEFLEDMEKVFSADEDKPEFPSPAPPMMEATQLRPPVMRESRPAVDSAPMEDYDEDEEEEAIYEEEEEEEEETNGGKVKSAPIFTLILVMFLFIVTFTLYKRGDLSVMFGRDVVPDLEGINLSAAREKVDAKGWQIQIEEEVFHDRIPEGIIVSQRPALGDKLSRGGTIYVVISKGKTKVEVPDVTGLSVGEARAVLSESRLGWTIHDSVNSDTIKRDCIVSQDPPAHEEVSPNSKIRLVVSLGGKKVAVPDLVGMTLDKAQAEVAKKGFSVAEESRDFSSSYPEGQIISQDPAPGKMVDGGVKISVVISKGAKVLVSPELVGKTLQEAMEMLDTLKIQLEVTDGTSDQNARIIGQEPAPGEELSEKTVRVWCGENVTVPAMLGKKLEEAQNQLDKLGLNVKIEYLDGEVEEKVVLEQRPASGQTVSRGSTVTIVISRKPAMPKVEPTPAPTKETGATPRPTDGVIIQPVQTPTPAPSGEIETTSDPGVEIIR